MVLLDGGSRELELNRGMPCYWIAPERRIILLTVFVKARRQERREIDRARRAMERCITERHTVEDE